MAKFSHLSLKHGKVHSLMRKKGKSKSQSSKMIV